MDGHEENLHKLCRVCGDRVQTFQKRNTKKPVKKCSMYTDKIKAKYNIDVSFDEPLRHPPYICHLCYSNLFLPILRQMPNDWSVHPEKEPCNVCSKVLQDKRGRPRKAKYARVTELVDIENNNKTEVTARCEMLSQKTISFPSHNFTCDDSSFICKLCNALLSRPVETPCEHIFCLPCLQKEFTSASSCSIVCKTCKQNINLKEINPPKQYFMDVLQAARVKCSTCKRSSWMNNTNEHDCFDPKSSLMADEKVYKDILESNVAPLGKVGQQLTSHLLKKCMDDTGGTTVRLATKGAAMYVKRVPYAQKPSTDVDKRTIQRRTKLLKDNLNDIAEDQSNIQLGHLIQSSRSRRSLQDLVGRLQMKTHISAQHELALKADLGLSWAGLRGLKMWLRQYNVIMENEQSSRAIGKKSVGQNMLVAERLPFLSSEGNSMTTKPAPCVYISDLPTYIMDEYDRSGKLYWHKEQPLDEVWLKIGGDKGGGSFKLMLELANTQNPNSKLNTIVLCAFQSTDTAVNLHIGLDRYKEQVDSISKMSWRGKKLVVYLFGDYEFLCRMMGISGASGRQPCIWCNITSADMALEKGTRPPCEGRTIEGLHRDHELFLAAGGQLKKAKYFNNAIDKPFFSIPIRDVCPPTLHISLGIWFKMYTLFEEECKRLGEDIAEELACSPALASHIGEGPFPLHVAKLAEVHAAKVRVGEIREEIAEVNEQLAVIALLNDNIDVAAVMSDATAQTEALNNELQREEATANAEIRRLPEIHNPLLNKLDTALQDMKVRRQAYYSNTFVGNHVHKCLKEANIHKITQAVINEVEQLCPSKLDNAKAIAEKFSALFTLFSACHNVFNKVDHMSEPEISELDGKIQHFMSFFRARFPDKTIPPKMHMLEDHIIPFIQHTHHGLGLLGEQGGESMHAIFNILDRRFNGARNTKKHDPELQKMLCIMREHHISVNPSISSLCPKSKPRKRSHPPS